MVRGDSDRRARPAHHSVSDPTAPDGAVRAAGPSPRPRLKRVFGATIWIVGTGVAAGGLYMAGRVPRLGNHGLAYAVATVVGLCVGLGVLAGLVGWACGARARLDELARGMSVGPWLRGMFYGVCAPVLVCVIANAPSGRVTRQILRGAAIVCWAAFWFWMVRGRGARHHSVVRRMVRVADLVAFNLFMFVILVELVLRTYAWLSPKQFFFQTDSRAAQRVASYRLRPGTWVHGLRVNAHGYFDEPFSVEKPPGTFRIVALGDSFAVGMVPYQNNFLTLVERDLNARRPGGRRVEVYNMGILATAFREYLHVLKTEGLSYAPDWVLVCVFVGNDIHRSRPTTLLQKEGWVLYVAGSRAWRLLRAPAPGLRRAVGPDASVSEGATTGIAHRAAWRQDETAPTFAEHTYLQIEATRVDVCQRHLGRAARGYAYVTQSLAQIQRLVQGRMTVLMIPDEYQVDPGLFGKVVVRYGLNPGDFDLDQPQRLLGETCRRLGIGYVDVLPAFRRRARGGALYICQDSHWNTPGNRLAADLLTPVLERVVRQACAVSTSQPSSRPASR